MLLLISSTVTPCLQAPVLNMTFLTRFMFTRGVAILKSWNDIIWTKIWANIRYEGIWPSFPHKQWEAAFGRIIRYDLIKLQVEFMLYFQYTILLDSSTKLWFGLFQELAKQIDDYTGTYEPEDQMEWNLVLGEIKAFIEVPKFISWNFQFWNMSLVMRKPVFGMSNQVRLKPACSADEISTGWSVPLLFTYGINRFSHDVARISKTVALKALYFQDLGL